MESSDLRIHAQILLFHRAQTLDKKAYHTVDWACCAKGSFRRRIRIWMSELGQRNQNSRTVDIPDSRPPRVSWESSYYWARNIIWLLSLEPAPSRSVRSVLSFAGDIIMLIIRPLAETTSNVIEANDVPFIELERALIVSKEKELWLVDDSTLNFKS